MFRGSFNDILAPRRMGGVHYDRYNDSGTDPEEKRAAIVVVMAMTRQVHVMRAKAVCIDVSHCQAWVILPGTFQPSWP